MASQSLPVDIGKQQLRCRHGMRGDGLRNPFNAIDHGRQVQAVRTGDRLYVVVSLGGIGVGSRMYLGWGCFSGRESLDGFIAQLLLFGGCFPP